MRRIPAAAARSASTSVHGPASAVQSSPYISPSTNLIGVQYTLFVQYILFVLYVLYVCMYCTLIHTYVQYNSTYVYICTTVQGSQMRALTAKLPADEETVEDYIRGKYKKK